MNRDNVDPTGARTDAELNEALSLIHDNSNAASSSSRNDKFRLDSTVLNEGGNFSAGERQLRMSLTSSVSKFVLMVCASRVGEGTRSGMQGPSSGRGNVLGRPGDRWHHTEDYTDQVLGRYGASAPSPH